LKDKLERNNHNGGNFKKKTEITGKELNKKVKNFKAKLMRGKTIAFSMLITYGIIFVIGWILKIMGFTGEESGFMYWLFMVLGLIAFVCVYPGLYALIRLKHIIKLLKNVKELEINGTLKEMVFDFETSELVNFGDKAILSDKYLFSKNGKKIPIPCNEIYWMYLTTFNGYTSIKLGTKNNGIISYSGVEVENRRYREIISDAFCELQDRTDTEILWEYSAENKAKYEKMVNK